MRSVDMCDVITGGASGSPGLSFYCKREATLWWTHPEKGVTSRCEFHGPLFLNGWNPATRDEAERAAVAYEVLET